MWWQKIRRDLVNEKNIGVGHAYLHGHTMEPLVRQVVSLEPPVLDRIFSRENQGEGSNRWALRMFWFSQTV
jgi:hypothetical protein